MNKDPTYTLSLLIVLDWSKGEVPHPSLRQHTHFLLSYAYHHPQNFLYKRPMQAHMNTHLKVPH